ncbi:response regulator transcription factor [Sphingomonas flavalba]|uniref:response regulator transcription factor n=1 Tax=Sphingomonas flavalba TaxID=2559804 RepID=UPI0039DF4AAB
MAYKVLIVDDHPMCGAALAMATRAVDPSAVVEQVGTLGEAEAKAKAQPFDLVLLDLMLPDVAGMGGLMLVRHVLPKATVAVVSSREDPAVIRRAAHYGAKGFIPKSAAMSDMIESLRQLVGGEAAFPGAVLDDDTPDPVLDKLSSLSAAQLRVLRAIAGGRQNKQIAYDLGIAEPTVKSHLAAIFRKLEVSNRTQAVLLYRSLDVQPD